jgi:hypothetical protein
MKLHEITESQYTPADLFSALCQKSVRETACKRSGAMSWNIDIESSADGATVVVERVLPPEVPDIVRKFVGDSITVTQREVWGPAGPDGSRTATLEVTIAGQPAKMVGTITLDSRGGGGVQTVDGDVSVSIPIFGRMVEPEIVKVIAKALHIEQNAGQEWLDAR